MLKLITKIAELAEMRVKKYGAQYYTFSFFVILHYPISYYYESSSESLSTNFWLRFIPIILCVLLLLKNKWPEKLKSFIPLFWYIAVVVSFPVVASYLLLANNFSIGWLVNYNIGIIITILLLDWLSFAIVELLGTSFGILIFYISGNELSSLPDHDFFPLFFYMLFYIVFCGIIFTRNKEIHSDYLQKAKDELNISLNSLVEEKTNELSISNKELSHALAAKTEFLNNMSHEIRTPIQGFTAISEGLVDHWNDFAEAKKFELASQVAKNATRLSKLLGNLLDLSKFTAGKMVLEFNKYDMTAIVADIIDECEALYIGDRNIKLKMMSANSQIVMVDKERISQVLRNLLVNAIKFSSDDSEVTVSVKRTELKYDNGNLQEAIEVIVQDQGIGIPPEELELIFKPFTQSRRTKTKAGGTGLGLAICREIITAHHGKIWAENIIVGASFHFVIPIIQSKLMDDGKIVETASAKLSQTKQAEITMSVKPATILLIDDEESCHMSMELLLHNSNYKLLKAVGGVEGKELLKKYHHEIDLILLDLMMPDIYGLNLLGQIKANPDYQHIPVILQTGTSDEEEINKAYKLGIVAYIRKPYKKNMVLELLANILKL